MKQINLVKEKMESNLPPVSSYEKVDPEEIINKLKEIILILNRRRIGEKNE